MSWVDTLPDDFQIPPADDFLFAQGDNQSVLERDVGFVHLDTPMQNGGNKYASALYHEYILLSDTRQHTTLTGTGKRTEELPQTCLHTC